jgi:hypothetical protein
MKPSAALACVERLARHRVRHARGDALHAAHLRRRGAGGSAGIESAIAEIARSGNPEATSSDSARASEALGLFVGDTVACLDRNG